MGAISHELVLRGEVWRLIASMFLHGGWLHWLSNSWALYQLGTLYEVLFGSKRFTLIFFATGIVRRHRQRDPAPNGPAVGASGAVFGIMGAFIFSIRRSPLYRHQPWTRSLIGQLVFWIAVNIAIGYSLPFIDNVAHLGGLIAGLILGLIPHRVPPPPPRESVIDVGTFDSAHSSTTDDTESQNFALCHCDLCGETLSLAPTQHQRRSCPPKTRSLSASTSARTSSLVATKRLIRERMDRANLVDRESVLARRAASARRDGAARGASDRARTRRR